MLKKKYSIKILKKIKPYKKSIFIDSDKSISIRSFLIGSISEGVSEVKNVLESEDVISTISSLKKLGIKIIKINSQNYKIYGKGLGSLAAKKNTVINCGNSGTLARLLIGILSTTPNIKVKVTGDISLKKRNMSKLISLMDRFGAEFSPKNRKNFPLTLQSSEMPIGINYNAGVSAQLKSAVILSGLNSHGQTKILEKEKSRNHTENMILKNSDSISIIKDKIKIEGKKPLRSFKLNVPGDPSSAAFFTALTLLNKNSYLKISNTGLNTRRIGFYKLLKKNGAKIFFKKTKIINNELVGDIHVYSSTIKSITASSSYYSSATDEYPIMFVIAALSKGVSSFHGINDLANKESNRIKEMKKVLIQLGIKCVSKKNSMKIFGKTKINKKNIIIKVPSLGDHRICMSTVILSLITGIKSNINGFETVDTSSPSFLNIIKKLGGSFEIKKR